MTKDHHTLWLHKISLLLVRNLGFANWIRCTLFKHIIAMCVPTWMDEKIKDAVDVKIKETTNKEFSDALSLLVCIFYAYTFLSFCHCYC